MTSDVDICNRALGAMGARATIASLTPSDGSKEADACALHYAVIRDGLISAANWNFCRKTALLTLLKAAPGTPENPGPSTGGWNASMPAPPWLYAYAVPSDCIQMRRIHLQMMPNGVTGIPLTSAPQLLPAGDTGGKRKSAPFQVAADTDANGNPITVVLTNVSQAIGVYSVRVTSPDLWGAQFQKGMAASLAAVLTVPLSGNLQLQKMNLEIVRGIIDAAALSDANEGTERQNPFPEWLTIRGAGDGMIGGFGDGFAPWALATGLI